ncbi:hypothetical protein CAEBREN_08268 [Caenorhabditis brenneri]|uniref:Transmembrane protein n=1 Tax=Caenorhabditis brenneri TaxID=135651 RepID=G0PAV8_CAEBE|nr:hypothetical protein CAEBREN_08268 [Caenorhabditis brenneri]
MINLSIIRSHELPKRHREWNWRLWKKVKTHRNTPLCPFSLIELHTSSNNNVWLFYPNLIGYDHIVLAIIAMYYMASSSCCAMIWYDHNGAGCGYGGGDGRW